MMDGQKGKRRAGEGVRSPGKGKILAVLLFWDRGNLLATLIYGRTCVRVCRGTLRAMGPPLVTEVPVQAPQFRGVGACKCSVCFVDTVVVPRYRTRGLDLQY